MTGQFGKYGPKVPFGTYAGMKRAAGGSAVAASVSPPKYYFGRSNDYHTSTNGFHIMPGAVFVRTPMSKGYEDNLCGAGYSVTTSGIGYATITPIGGQGYSYMGDVFTNVDVDLSRPSRMEGYSFFPYRAAGNSAEFGLMVAEAEGGKNWYVKGQYTRAFNATASDGFIYLCTGHASNTHGRIAKYNAITGSEVWERSYTKTGTHQVAEIKAHPEGRIFALMTDADSASALYIMEIDTDGYILNIVQISTDTNFNGSRMRMNVTEDGITIVHPRPSPDVGYTIKYVTLDLTQYWTTDITTSGSGAYHGVDLAYDSTSSFLLGQTDTVNEQEFDVFQITAAGLYTIGRYVVPIDSIATERHAFGIDADTETDAIKFHVGRYSASIPMSSPPDTNASLGNGCSWTLLESLDAQTLLNTTATTDPTVGGGSNGLFMYAWDDAPTREEIT